MNKKAQAGIGIWVIFGMMIGLMGWIAFTQMIVPLNDETQNARAVTGLDCDNSSISVGTKGTCVLIDWSLPYFVGVVLAVAFGGIGAFATKRFIEVK